MRSTFARRSGRPRRPGRSSISLSTCRSVAKAAAGSRPPWLRPTSRVPSGRALAFAVVALVLRLPVGLHLAGGERDVPAAAAAPAALLAGEALLGIEE